MKRVLVTGGSGFVGTALVRRLRTAGVDVVAVARRPASALEQMGAVMKCGDIRDEHFVIDAARGCDTIFHTAAKAGIWGKWEEYYATNVVGTKNVLSACRKGGPATLVYTSTPSVVFDQGDICGGDETLPYARTFLCAYAETKAEAEQLVLRDKEVPSVALRPHLIWGPGDTNLIPRLLARGRQGSLKQVGDGTNQVAISYIDNVVDAHIQAAENLHAGGRARGNAYFISQETPVALWGWINDLFQRLDIPQVTKAISYRRAYRAGQFLEWFYTLLNKSEEPLMTRFLAQQLAASHWFSIKKAQDDFGYSPRIGTEEGLERLVEEIKKGSQDEKN